MVKNRNIVGLTPIGSRWVKVRSQIDSNYWSEAKSFYDGIGRTYKTQKTDVSDPEGDIFTYTCFDNMGRVTKTSNPFRNVSSPDCSSSLKWTVPEYDDLSRTDKVTSPDTRDVTISFGLSVTGVIGTTKTVTDQAGKKRTGITDALGNMIRVIEDPSGQALQTDYVFDTLGNLRKTTQGAQNRYFRYDSLGRVLFAKQVEQDANSNFSGTNYADPLTSNDQWSVKYTYDDNSNILTTTDARNKTITATYDRLNRLTKRDYSDDSLSPDAWFYYDGKYLDANNAAQTATGSVKGKTTGIKSTVSRTNSTSFDTMGRLLTSQQITDGQTYSFGYSYNLSGALIEETYPSGRVVKNTLNADGELAQVQSKKNSSQGFWAYANSFNYNAAGAVTKMQLGNGRWETADYNDRLQVKMIGLGSTDLTQDILKLDFDYEGPSPSTTAADRNNGSMRKQTITVPAVGSNAAFVAVQTYTYDSLNRIFDTEEKVSGTTTWKQTFNYDIYGNRRFNTTGSNTTTLGTCSTAICNPTFPTDSSNRNRFTSGQNYSYDAEGSVTQDAAGQRFGYDAENRQKEFFAANNNTSTPDATYSFDGDGNRVKKVNGEEVTIFVYDASGLLAAEYSTTVVPVEDAKVAYMTTDHLGSPRIVTDRDGNVISRKDFTAFGETVTSSQRTSGTTGNGYDPPTVRQDYTGYQKDAESGLEYAQARYYNPQHGRFTSVDPLPSSATIRNPQSFNRYSYGFNSPYKFTDPLGLYNCLDDKKEGKKCSSDNDKRFEKQLRIAQNQLTIIREFYGSGSDEYLNAKRAVEAFGGAGSDNGVNVQFGPNSDNAQGATDGVFKDGKKNVTVTIDLKKNQSDATLIKTIAHEGSHVADRVALANTMAGASSKSDWAAYSAAINNDSLNITHNESEKTAFGVSSVYAQFLNKNESGISSAGGNTTFKMDARQEEDTLGSTNIKIWESPWQGEKIQTIRGLRSERIDAGLKADPVYLKKASTRLFPRE